MDRIEDLLRRFLRSWSVAFVAAATALAVGLDEPARLKVLVAGLTVAWLLLTTILDWRRAEWAGRVLRAASWLALAVGVGVTVELASIARLDDEVWEDRAIAHLEAQIEPAREAMLDLQRRARERAMAALEEGADLEPLARELPFFGRDLSVGISVFERGEIVDWSGEVPGPERVGRADLPLVVDHGYSRFLTVRVDDGIRRAYCDVRLGVIGELLPDVGVGPRPGQPMADALGLEVQIRPRPAPRESSRHVRVVPVSEEQPWVWIELRAPLAVEVRQETLGRVAQWGAWALLLSLLPALFLAWRSWPGRRQAGWDGLRTAGVVAAVAYGRVVIERLGIFDLAAAGDRGGLGVLLEPSLFYVDGAGGLLRSALDFLLSGAVLAAASVALLPLWLRWLQRRSGLPRALAWASLVVASAAVVYASATLQAIVANAAQPLLIGLDSAFFTIPFVTLHLAFLLTLIGPAVWVVFGWQRWARSGRRPWLGVVIAVAVLSLLPSPWETSGPWTRVWLPILPLLGALLVRPLTSPSFARRAFAGLVAVLWFAGLQSQGLEAVYSGIKQAVARQEATKRLKPEDTNLAFLVEDILRGWADDRDLVSRLCDPRAQRINVAFELWARTFLPLQRDGCRLELRSEDGTIISEFDIGLPYEPTPLRVWRKESTVQGQPYQVETVQLSTEQGPFLVYRGVLDLKWLKPEGDASQLVLDLPFAAAGGTTPLDRGSLSGPQLLGLAGDEATLPPRQTFDRAVLIGQVENGVVNSATDPGLIGLRVDDLASEVAWRAHRIGGRTHRVAVVTGDGKSLVVAFAEPSAVERILDFSRLAALYLALVSVGVVLLLLLGRLRPRAMSAWPEAFGRVGFQERLLAAMLAVVLAPVFVLGVFQERRATEGMREDNLAEVSDRLGIALQLLASNLDDLATGLIDTPFVQERVEGLVTETERTKGSLELSEITIFGPTGRLVYDETGRDALEPEELDRFLTAVRGGRLLLDSSENGWFLGRAYPVLGGNGRTSYVYVRRLLDDEDLGRIARTVRADLTVYDGSWAVLSSQAYLFRAGLRSPVLPVAARPLLDGASLRVVEAQAQGRLVVAHGYGVLAGPDGPQRGVLAARLLGHATEAAREQRRAQLFVFGLSSLAIVLAAGAGFLLSGRIVGPIQSLVAATIRVGRGDLDVSVPEGGTGEIGQLVESFNRMIADLRRTRDELAARRSFLEAMLGSLSSGVLVLDEDGTVIEENPAASERLGSQREEFLERVRVLPRDEAMLETEVLLHRAIGPRTLRTVITQTQLEDGHHGALVVFDDVTELLASRRLSLYAQMARQVAHEVKNPLTPIQLSAQMIRQALSDDHPRLEEIVEKNIGLIESQVERLRSIASEFSLLGRERLEDIEEIEIGPVLQEVRSLYPSPDGSSPVTAEGGEGVRVMASRSALLKVLTNLVENARQAMPEGGRVHLEASAGPDGCEVRVRDEGPGISPEVEGRLFEPYFSTKSTGTGLGLVICRSLMEKMGGSIALRNREDGKGAEAILGLAPPRPSSEAGIDRNDSGAPA